MKKILLTAMSGLIILSANASPKKNQKNTPGNWKEEIAASKIAIARKITTRYESPVIYPKQATTPISMSVAGWENLVLNTYGTADGEKEDFGVWINARLIDAAGNVTPLQDLKNKFQTTGTFIYNQNIKKRGNPVLVNKKTYTETIIGEGNSILSVPLDKKYVRFECEVGIDDNSKEGSVIFQILPVSPAQESKRLLTTYKADILPFYSFCFHNFQLLLLQNHAEIERQQAHAAIDRLAQRDYFLSAIKKADSETDITKQVKEYLTIFEDATRIADLEDQLNWLNMEAIDKAMANMSTINGYDQAKNKAYFNQLKALVSKGFSGIYNNDVQTIQDLQTALSLKKKILLNNPLLDVDKLIVGHYDLGNKARSSMPPQLGTQPNNWSNQTSARQSGFKASIEELSGLRNNLSSRTIFKPEHSSSVPDLTLHWDADRLLFTMAEPGDHHWQVYEINTDGSNFRKITNGTAEDLDYFDATYLPNGQIMAASNVGGQGVPCVSGSDQVGNLCIFNPENKAMRRLTFDQDANWGPVVMNNGRVMYVRWEYTDLTHYFSRIVMHMNPDGTEQRSLYGSGSVFPTSIYDVQPLPDHPTRFIGIISGHHGVQRSGRLILFDPAQSRIEEKGMVQELPFSKRPIVPIVKDRMVDGVWPQFLKPQPLNQNYYIVTAKLSPNGLWGIYLVDVYDNLTLITETEGEGYIYGIPVVKRQTPPVIPEKINTDSKEATVFIQDIYEGEGLPDVPRGTVKHLRIFAYEYAYLKTRSDHTAHGIQSGWDIKRLLGTVPVEEDGSVMFRIPANTPISLQPLDEEGRAIQWMRSWLTGQPGETVSCVGCHEDQNQIPMPKRVLASKKHPQKIQKPEGGVRSFTFDLEIQPILDRNCISCHDGTKGKLNYVGGRKDAKGYGLSYLDLHPYVHRQGPEAGMKVLYPYEYHASVSPLVQMLKNGHFGVELTDKEWRTLYNWIDFNAPDKGMFKADMLPSLQCDQIDRRIELNKKYANGVFADWKEELKQYTEYLASQAKPEPAQAIFKKPTYKEVKLKNFPFTPNNEEETIRQERKTIEIAPGVKITLVKIPAGQFIMGKNKMNTNYAPAHKAEVKKAFWMSEKEITNEQFNVFFPKHSSRFVDQQWKDHVTEGYIAFKPKQPVIRVSMNEAASFCEQAGKKTGMKISLPTETQWEWACRAGSDEDFWYGNLNSDFSKFENMSDKQMNKMAVVGVDPQPMDEKNEWYPYYTFLPKMQNVDDGNMIMATPGSYQANPFGLYDMHGNVAEWTCSDYVPYNQKKVGTSELKVVRGGSWKDHPKRSTAASRRAYYPYQKVHNVGFRIIIEE
ncbi:MAG: SUMF1/EgtB/PvdO family nonheme iron enzyme [Bacteroidales bacterium]